MPIQLETLRAGGPSYSVEKGLEGFTLHVIAGEEAIFTALVQRIVETSGLDYLALPRSDGRGGYDCVHIIPY